MFAQEFREALAGARDGGALDELARALWRAVAEGRLADADADALSRAIEGRRDAIAQKAPGRPPLQPKGASGSPRAGKRRKKVFGLGRPRAMDRNAKARVMHLARAMSRRTAKGKAYGPITAKALAVLEALLWGFHNAKSGVCFPSYAKIAERAGCAASTVAEAIKALEAAGLMTWINRIKRVRVPCPDLLGAGGWRWRVLRTSNAYEFPDPGAAASRPASESENPRGTEDQAIPLFKNRHAEAAETLIRGAAMRFAPA
jgi:hypothetical protein